MGSVTYEDFKVCAAMAREAKSLKGQLDTLWSLATKTTTHMTQVQARSEGAHTDRVLDSVIKLEALTAKWEAKIEAYLDHILEVELAISQASDRDGQRILRMRYIDGMTFPQISKASHYARSWCYVLHDRALAEIGIDNPKHRTHEDVAM